MGASSIESAENKFFFLSWNYTKRRRRKKENSSEQEREGKSFLCCCCWSDPRERERIKRELPSSGEKKKGKKNKARREKLNVEFAECDQNLGAQRKKSWEKARIKCPERFRIDSLGKHHHRCHQFKKEERKAKNNTSTSLSEVAGNYNCEIIIQHWEKLRALYSTVQTLYNCHVNRVSLSLSLSLSLSDSVSLVWQWQRWFADVCCVSQKPTHIQITK